MGKKGFVLYFDSRECLKLLSQEEKGDLLDALFDYAQTAAEGRLELPDQPAMGLGCRMAFTFLAGIIRRDTVKWLEKHERYAKAAQDRVRREREDRRVSVDRDPFFSAGERRRRQEDQCCDRQGAWRYVD
jgi:hypothetical protein